MKPKTNVFKVRINEINYESDLLKLLVSHEGFILLSGTLFLVLPQTALASIRYHWLPTSFAYWPIILITEFVYFWFYTNILLNRRISILKISLAIILSNFITLFCIAPGLTYSYTVTIGFILFVFIVFTFIKWGFYILIIMPTRKSGIGIFDLLRISFIANAMTIATISLLL